jgi:hypothetical protein
LSEICPISLSLSVRPGIGLLTVFAMAASDRARAHNRR